MNKRTKRLAGMLTLAAGGLIAGGAVLLKKGRMKRREDDDAQDVWARPGMNITFRAELMPGRGRSERTFRIERVLPSGRVTLKDFTGEHAEREFEPVRFE